MRTRPHASPDVLATLGPCVCEPTFSLAPVAGKWLIARYFAVKKTIVPVSYRPVETSSIDQDLSAEMSLFDFR
jgi:hypothetical protein